MLGDLVGVFFFLRVLSWGRAACSVKRLQSKHHYAGDFWGPSRLGRFACQVSEQLLTYFLSLRGERPFLLACSVPLPQML